MRNRLAVSVLLAGVALLAFPARGRAECIDTPLGCRADPIVIESRATAPPRPAARASRPLDAPTTAHAAIASDTSLSRTAAWPLALALLASVRWLALRRRIPVAGR